MATWKAFIVRDLTSAFYTPFALSYGNLSGTVKVNGVGVSRDIAIFKNKVIDEAYTTIASESDGTFTVRVLAGVRDRFTLLAKGNVEEGEKDAVFNNVAAILE